MLLAKISFVCFLITVPFVSPREIFFGSGDPVIAPRGYHGQRFFGDLSTEYTIDPSGKSTICTLYVSSVFAGIEALTATDPTYNFDLKVGLGTANGTITLNLVDSPLVSKLKGDFTYTVTGNNTSFNFKGDLIGWYNSNR